MASLRAAMDGGEGMPTATAAKGYHGVKPGWTRVSFAYYLAAVDLVAAHGHRFLPLYAFDWRTGDWRFRRGDLKRHLMTHELLHHHHHLGGCCSAATTTTSSSEYSDDAGEVQTAAGKGDGDVSADRLEGYLESARRIARSLPDTCDRQVNVPEGVDPDIVLFRV